MEHAYVHFTIKKRRKTHPRVEFSTANQCQKLTQLIQLCERHALVTLSGNECFYLLHDCYIDQESRVRSYARAQLLGASYAEAVTSLNRIYGAALDPSRANGW